MLSCDIRSVMLERYTEQEIAVRVVKIYAMRIEEIIGRRITVEREKLGLTQAQLGEHLQGLLGRKWSRQAVSSAEKGRRVFAASDLVAFAAALDVTVDRLVIAPAGIQTVILVQGQTIPAWQLTNPLNFEPSLAPSNHLRTLKSVFGEMQALMDRAAHEVEEINTAVAYYERLLTSREREGQS